MIKLNNARTGSPLWINPDKVVDLGESALSGQEVTFITMVNSKEDDEFNNLVTESPEEVTRKILEYKLAMVRYSSVANRWAFSDEDGHDDLLSLEEQDIKELAGLEE